MCFQHMEAKIPRGRCVFSACIQYPYEIEKVLNTLDT